jgi:hypothetical protein
MTACPDKEMLLQGLVDGELDAANAAAAETHLEDLPGVPNSAPGGLCVAAPGVATGRSTPCAGGSAVAGRPRRLRAAAPRASAAGSHAGGHLRPHAQPPDTAPWRTSWWPVRSTLARTWWMWTSDRREAVVQRAGGLALPVVDLADQGFPPIGGRLHRRRVAALVYRRNKHV